MAIPKDQAEEIKNQLLSQVDKLPQENKDQIKKYIEGLNEEELEAFLKQNKIDYKTVNTNEPLPKEECVFCAIIKGAIPSYKIAESKKAIAILDINPLSKGHSIILPIEHKAIEKMPKAALSLAQKITKKIKKKLKPEDIKIETSSFMGHAMINVIPIYKDVPLKKIKADEKTLAQLQSKLETKKRSSRKTASSKSEKSSAIPTKKLPDLPVFKRRIP